MAQKDHFIPRSYLAAWGDPHRGNMVHVYSKRTGGHRLQKAAKLCRINDGDRIDLISDPYVLRKLLELVEPSWPARARALETGTIAEPEIFAATLLIAYLITCSPTAARHARDMLTAKWEAMRPLLADLGASAVPEDRRADIAAAIRDPGRIAFEFHRAYPRAFSFRSISALHDRIGSGEWHVINAPPGCSFLTSDYPAVHLLNRAGMVMPALYMPVTPRCAVRVVPAARAEGDDDAPQSDTLTIGSMLEVNATARGVAYLNECLVKQADDLILSHREDPQVADLTRRFRHWRTHAETAAVPRPTGGHLFMVRRVVGPGPEG